MPEFDSPWLATAKGAEYKEARVFYTKTGRAKYISHLDVTRCFQRALQRAGLSVWYTEGFNPHSYLTFTLPLPLGYESLCESMDLRLTLPTALESAEQVRDRLNGALPPDFRVSRVSAPAQKPEAVTKARYQIRLTAQGADGASLQEGLLRLLDSGPIEVEKRGKKGVKIIDIRPDAELLSIEALPDGLSLSLVMTAGPARNVNPTLLTDEFCRRAGLAEPLTAVVREALLCADGSEFE